MNHERNKAQAAYLSVMERALSHDGALSPIEKGSFRNLLTGGALSHEGAPSSIEKGSFRNLLTGGALFLMRARPLQLKRALSEICSQGARSFS
jgi:hypothetical protein